jgi:hypothetical protein
MSIPVKYLGCAWFSNEEIGKPAYNGDFSSVS